jgi:hypothetical protein
MACKIGRRVEGGELLEVATVEDFSQAKQLLESFQEHFPGDYLIQDSVSDLEADH